MEAYTIPNQEAVTELVGEFFCRFSVPEQLHSDQGRQFESGVMQGGMSRYIKVAQHHTIHNRTALLSDLTGH